MKQPIASLFLVLGFASASSATQTILTFDDVPVSHIVPMPVGYGGVSWAANMGIWFGNNPAYNPQSPPNRVLFNIHGEQGIGESIVTFISGPVIFDGAYFSGYDDVHFNLYNGATLVASSITLNLGIEGGTPGQPTFLASGYSGPVDKIGIVSQVNYASMDNFTFESVPEPYPAGFLIVGLAALVVRSRQQ